VYDRVSYPSRPDLGWETLHDGRNFVGPFIGSGRRILIDPVGYEYKALRKGGWPAFPSFFGYAISAMGLEA
jgi:hypothetical protein